MDDLRPRSEDLTSAFKSGGVEACRRLLERKRNEWEHLPLNVAVIGNSGVGKSAFINAIRHLTGDDEGAADADVTEGTADIRSYSHPNNPLMKFWDLPGVGTNEFPKVTYLSTIHIDRYDVFLLITATRFTENDTWLGNEFRIRNKKYFFVRTKMGIDVSNNKKTHPRTHNENEVISRIRASTEQHLRENGCEVERVFLIDSLKTSKFEFNQLEHYLVEEFPNLKRTALIMSLHDASREMIQLEVARLHSRMWKVAALSGSLALIPVRGVSVAIDFGFVAREAKIYFKQLGLDQASLERHASLTSADYQQLQVVVKNSLGCTDISVESIKKLLSEVSKRSTPLMASAAAKEYSMVLSPMIGSFVGPPVSFGGTYSALKLILHKMESVALEVITFAAQSVGVTEQSDDDQA